MGLAGIYSHPLLTHRAGALEAGVCLPDALDWPAGTGERIEARPVRAVLAGQIHGLSRSRPDLANDHTTCPPLCLSMRWHTKDIPKTIAEGADMDIRRIDMFAPAMTTLAGHGRCKIVRR